MNFDRRIWLLVVAGAIISGATYWRMQRDARSGASTTSSEPLPQTTIRPAPLFEAFNEGNQIVRLATFAGRHEIWVVFFHLPLDRDPLMQKILRVADDADAAGIKIIGVTPALPQHNRPLLKSLDHPPISVVTDPEPIYKLHHEWSLVDKATGEIRPALFVIDRSGNVNWSNGHPMPVADVDALLERFK